MKIRMARKIREGGATRHAAIEAETVTCATHPTRIVTKQSRMRTVIAQADNPRVAQGGVGRRSVVVRPVNDLYTKAAN